MAGGNYGTSPCEICGRQISLAGFAQHSHYAAHERRGETGKGRLQMVVVEGEGQGAVKAGLVLVEALLNR